ncbi:MAG: thioredoxin domain-containing protein [Candidatus Gracilibacteria bacterium]
MKMKNINVWMVAFFFLIGLILGAATIYCVGKWTSLFDKTVVTTEKQPEDKVVSFNMKDLVALGSDSAPITVVEFSDFQCPACSGFETQVWPEFKAKFIDTGKVKFYMKNFPLFSIHPQAEKAAEASQCAFEQGKYWEMHDSLYTNVKQWSGNKKAEDVFVSLAKKLSLDEAKFKECLTSNKYQEFVVNSLKEGIAAEVEGTPTFFVNGEKAFFGVYPVSSFETYFAKLGVN